MKDISHIPNINQVKIEEGFWGDYQKLVSNVIIPNQWNIFNDEKSDIVPSNVVENFRLAAEKMKTGIISKSYMGKTYNDSDFYKWLEAVAYLLSYLKDPDLFRVAVEMIALIGESQEKDGYLHTYHTLSCPEKKWTNLFHNHELYCSGHLIEAAVAWYETTSRTDFIEIAEKNVRLILKKFGDKPGQIRGYPGHPEIELALMRLYFVTKKAEYRDLAEYFIKERGRSPSYFKDEFNKHREKKNTKVFRQDLDLKYCQAHKPIPEQSKIEGHAVRALYLLSGLVDVAANTGSDKLMDAAERQWQNCANQKMYITGGVGSTHHGESFTFDYDLPNDTVYSETCASVALVFAARRFLENNLDRKYADIMEKALYNTCIASIQMDGTRFLYVNPLMVWPEACKNDFDHKHVTPNRQKWFDCACCPTNVIRLLTSIGKYAFGFNKNEIHVHLFMNSNARFDLENGRVEINCQTRYPLNGTIKFQKSGVACYILLRIPEWCKKYSLNVNGYERRIEPHNGYIRIGCPEGNASIELELFMQANRMYSCSDVPENAGKVCLQRGPIVYCLEEHDNGKFLWNRQLSCGTEIIEKLEEDLLGGIVTLSAMGKNTIIESASLYNNYISKESTELIFVPYYAWSNRSIGEMMVWVQETE